MYLAGWIGVPITWTCASCSADLRHVSYLATRLHWGLYAILSLGLQVLWPYLRPLQGTPSNRDIQRSAWLWFISRFCPLGEFNSYFWANGRVNTDYSWYQNVCQSAEARCALNCLYSLLYKPCYKIKILT